MCQQSIAMCEVEPKTRGGVKVYLSVWRKARNYSRMQT